MRVRLRAVIYQEQQPMAGQADYEAGCPAVSKRFAWTEYFPSAFSQLVPDQSGQPEPRVVEEIDRGIPWRIAACRAIGHSLCRRSSRGLCEQQRGRGAEADHSGAERGT